VPTRPAGPDPIRILICDDHALFREGLARLLADERDCEVVGKAADGRQLVDLAIQLRPDVILLDVVMPGMDGIDAAGLLRKRKVPARIVMLSGFDDERFVLDAWKAGIHGYILKDTATAELVRAVRCVAEGEVWVGEGFLCRVMDKYRAALEGRADAGARPGGLTPREVEVLRLLAAGLRNKEIAARLFLSEKTVKVHLSHIYQRLGLDDRVEVALYAIRHGLVTVPRESDAPGGRPPRPV
jgi:two-component system NarL family response regulator